MNITKAAILILLFFSSVAFSSCYERLNSSGNYDYVCDDLDDYPDYNSSDNLDVNPSAWNNGHQAGADWAEKKGLSDPSECSGYSRSFVEGCRRSLGD